MQTWRSIPFADGEYMLRLGMAQIDEIETKCDAGIGEVYARTMKGRYGEGDDEFLPTEAAFRFRELVEIVRQMLIGGGEGIVDGATVAVSPVRANQLVERYLIGLTDYRLPMLKVWAIAAGGLDAFMTGYTPPGEVDAGANPATPPSG